MSVLFSIYDPDYDNESVTQSINCITYILMRVGIGFF